MGRPTKLELDEVLRRATHLFWTRGSGSVSTRDLEDVLDLRAPAIYHRFKSKDELLARCIDYYVENVVLVRTHRILEGARDPVQALHDFFSTTLDPFRGERKLRGCLLANTAAQAEGQVPEVRAAIHRGWRLLDEAFRKQIERGQEMGRIDPSLDPAALSQALVMSLQGLLTLVRADMTDLRPGIDATFRLLGTKNAN